MSAHEQMGFNAEASYEQQVILLHAGVYIDEVMQTAPHDEWKVVYESRRGIDGDLTEIATSRLALGTAVSIMRTTWPDGRPNDYGIFDFDPDLGSGGTGGKLEWNGIDLQPECRVMRGAIETDVRLDVGSLKKVRPYLEYCFNAECPERPERPFLPEPKIEYQDPEAPDDSYFAQAVAAARVMRFQLLADQLRASAKNEIETALIEQTLRNSLDPNLGVPLPGSLEVLTYLLAKRTQR